MSQTVLFFSSLRGLVIHTCLGGLDFSAFSSSYAHLFPTIIPICKSVGVSYLETAARCRKPLNNLENSLFVVLRFSYLLQVRSGSVNHRLRSHLVLTDTSEHLTIELLYTLEYITDYELRVFLPCSPVALMSFFSFGQCVPSMLL